VHSSAVTITA